MTDQAGVDEPRRRFVGKLPRVSREEIEEAERAREAEYPHISGEKPTALMLTQQEWDDLTVVMIYYRNRFSWIDDPDDPRAADFNVGPIRRKRALAERIIEANR